MESARYKTLGVYCVDEKVFICYQPENSKPNEFNVNYSKDGKVFLHFTDSAHIDTPGNNTVLNNISDFRFTKRESLHNLYFLSNFEKHTYLNLATSLDFDSWEYKGKLFPVTDPAVSIHSYSVKNQEVIFFGGGSLNIGLSLDGNDWNIKQIDIEESDYTVGHVTESPEGPLLYYFKNERHKTHNHYSIWTILLNKNDPSKVLWQPERAMWHQPQEWIDINIKPVGIIELSGTIYSYWQHPQKGVYCVVHNKALDYVEQKSEIPHATLTRVEANPILTPREDTMWESKQVFNAAAVEHNNSVHLFYRAIGDNDTSVLGHAISHDGVNIHEQFDKPAYIPRAEFEHPSFGAPIKTSPYESGGGGYGGIEDPRITKIEDKFYLTYIAYDGKNPPRVALSYIKIKDFENKNWKKWSKPVLISPPDVVDKNACILPEKIDGKYVIFHRIYPDIMIDMVDNLDFDGKSVWLENKKSIHPRPDFWDSNKVGMGPPPIKTKDGWLAIYQGVGFEDNGRYKIGAMLLDLKDPSKVLHRCVRPILEPITHYENNGFKAGVVYPCGAVVIENKLVIYYGGSDTYLAAATADLDQFLDALKFDNSPHLDPITLADAKNLNVEIN